MAAGRLEAPLLRGIPTAQSLDSSTGKMPSVS
jgi:hypothetical protein